MESREAAIEVHELSGWERAALGLAEQELREGRQQQAFPEQLKRYIGQCEPRAHAAAAPR